MAVSVVDILELVEIEQEHGKAMIPMRQVLDGFIQCIDENRAVGQAGKGIVTRLVACSGLAVQDFLGRAANAPEKQDSDTGHEDRSDQAEQSEFAQNIGGVARRFPDHRHAGLPVDAGHDVAGFRIRTPHDDPEVRNGQHGRKAPQRGAGDRPRADQDQIAPDRQGGECHDAESILHDAGLATNPDSRAFEPAQPRRLDQGLRSLAARGHHIGIARFGQDTAIRARDDDRVIERLTPDEALKGAVEFGKLVGILEKVTQGLVPRHRQQQGVGRIGEALAELELLAFEFDRDLTHRRIVRDKREAAHHAQHEQCDRDQGQRDGMGFSAPGFFQDHS